jgi:UrcA family protein
MRNLILIAALAAAVPAAASDITPWPVGNGYVMRFGSGEIATAEGRAALLAGVERSARKLCQNVHERRPRRNEIACEADVIERTVQSSRPGVARALDMARVERQDVMLSSQ